MADRIARPQTSITRRKIDSEKAIEMDTVAEISPQPFRDDQVYQIRLCILTLNVQTAMVSDGEQEAMGPSGALKARSRG